MLAIVIPERINEELLAWLAQIPLKIVMVIHCNHAQEIDESVRDALQKLQAINVTLLNQSVLLKNINDSAENLKNLSEALFAAGVLPYYLHLLDKVQGTAHFSVSEDDAKKLVWEIMQKLPGYLVPRLVKEVAGFQAKVPIDLNLSEHHERR